MKFVTEFRDPVAAKVLIAEIASLASDQLRPQKAGSLPESGT